jgi:hypothetical protein
MDASQEQVDRWIAEVIAARESRELARLKAKKPKKFADDDYWFEESESTCVGDGYPCGDE